jgi:hypothetical protein
MWVSIFTNIYEVLMILFCRLVSKLKKQKTLALALAYALDTLCRELSWQTLFA